MLSMWRDGEESTCWKARVQRTWSSVLICQETSQLDPKMYENVLKSEIYTESQRQSTGLSGVKMSFELWYWSWIDPPPPPPPPPSPSWITCGRNLTPTDIWCSSWCLVDFPTCNIAWQFCMLAWLPMNGLTHLELNDSTWIAWTYNRGRATTIERRAMTAS